MPQQHYLIDMAAEAAHCEGREIILRIYPSNKEISMATGVECRDAGDRQRIRSVLDKLAKLHHANGKVVAL